MLTRVLKNVATRAGRRHECRRGTGVNPSVETREVSTLAV
jgi:hypothetical protein